MGKLRPLRDVLRYYERKPHQNTIKRYYDAYLREQGLPVRCAETDCQFHNTDLIWR
jgi:hypothetical protein